MVISTSNVSSSNDVSLHMGGAGIQSDVQLPLETETESIIDPVPPPGGNRSKSATAAQLKAMSEKDANLHYRTKLIDSCLHSLGSLQRGAEGITNAANNTGKI